MVSDGTEVRHQGRIARAGRTPPDRVGGARDAGPAPDPRALRAEQPLAGIRMLACAHVTTETANLALTFQAGGADAVLCASNPLSTQDDVAAALVDDGIPVFAIKGEDERDLLPAHQRRARPQAAHHRSTTAPTWSRTAPHAAHRDLLARRHRRHRGDDHRRHPPAGDGADGVLEFPSSPSTTPTPSTSSTTATAPARAPSTASSAPPTSCSPARSSSSPATAGAARASRCAPRHGRQRHRHRDRPDRALEAAMDGFAVMPMAKAAPLGDIFVTVTGNINVIDREHFAAMKDGAIMANSGHFNAEINIKALEEMSGEGRRTSAPFVEEFRIADGQARDRARRGPADQPGRRRGPPGQRDGHELCQPGARRRVPGHGRQEPGAATSTPCPRTSTTRSRGSSLWRWASRSTRLTDGADRST